VGLTHVVEVLPEGLHPAVGVLPAVGGQSVGDLLSSVLVCDAHTLGLALGVLLRGPYSGFL
jgi:hypothetical protein